MALMKAMQPVAPVRREMERLFNRFFTEPFAPFETPLFETPTFEAVWTPSVDFSETDKEYVVRLDAAGIPKENLDVTLDGNMLTLSGRREARREEESEKYIWREREEGRFVRSIRLPTAIVEDKIEAVCHDGILTARLPKVEPTAKSKIVIK